jgi:PhzF family phenazine biosynthesis protein
MYGRMSDVIRTRKGPGVPTDSVQVERYSAFSDDPHGGNPAGVVLKASQLSGAQMQQIATDIGYSETAFVTGPISADGPIPIRYFAPEDEVDFCGHATIATAVAIGAAVGQGTYTLRTKAGPVGIVARRDGARALGTLRSPGIGCSSLEPELLAQLLDGLHWSIRDLDPAFPPAIGFGGVKHPVLVVGELERLAALSYDFDALQRLCRAQSWVTLQLVAAVGPGQWRARDPFPWGGVVEDPATGAAAAAFAGYLRSLGRANSGDSFVITQGVEMGRPSRIEVELLDDAALVTGAAARILPVAETTRDS